MWRIIPLILAVAFAALLSPAKGQTLSSHVSDNVVAEVQARFIRAFADGGIIGLVQDIKACYAATSDERTLANETAVASCLLYDYAAFYLNREMTLGPVGEGALGTSGSAYLMGSAFAARLDIYVGIAFGTDTQAFGPYVGDAPKKIMRAVEGALAKSKIAGSVPKD